MVDGIFDHLTCKPKLTIKAPDGLNYIDLDTFFDTDGTNALTLQIGHSIKLPCDAPNMDRVTLVNYIWKWTNSIWQSKNYTIPVGSNYIRFKDTQGEDGNYGDLALITITDVDVTDDPILTWSQGMVIKKDLAVGGYLASNQGAIALGSGLKSTSIDPPRVWLMHSENHLLHDINGSDTAPEALEINQMYIHTKEEDVEIYNHLFKCTAKSPDVWTDLGHKDYYNKTFDTLHIHRSNRTNLGNLKCADVYATSMYFGVEPTEDAPGVINKFNPNNYTYDANLYRYATSVLKTDANFVVGNAYLNVNPTSSNPTLNLQVNGSGKASFGHDGSDTHLVSYDGSLILTSANGVIQSSGNINIVKSGPVFNFYNGVTWLGDLGSDNSNFYLTARTGNLVLSTVSGDVVTDSKLVINNHLKVSGSIYLFNGSVNARIASDDEGKISLNYNNAATGSLVWYGGSTTSKFSIDTAGQVSLPIQGSSGGLVIGGDTNLYRSAADALKTDDTFKCYALGIGETNYGIVETGDFSAHDLYTGGTKRLDSSGVATITRLSISSAPNVNTGDIAFGKTGYPAPTAIRWAWSSRDNNMDALFYAYDGTTFQYYMFFDWANTLLSFRTNTEVKKTHPVLNLKRADNTIIGMLGSSDDTNLFLSNPYGSLTLSASTGYVTAGNSAQYLGHPNTRWLNGYFKNLNVANSGGSADLSLASTGTEAQAQTSIVFDNNPSDGTRRLFYLIQKDTGEIKFISYTPSTDTWRDPLLKLDYLGNLTAYGNVTINRSSPVLNFNNGATWLGDLGSDNSNFYLTARTGNLVLSTASGDVVINDLLMLNHGLGITGTNYGINEYGNFATNYIVSSAPASSTTSFGYKWEPSNVANALITFLQGTSTPSRFLPMLLMKPIGENMFGLW
ncbi:MAG: hypothetical protein NWF01_09650 [Candidatus Bathyarchaeota archaeon]|nr:hypothetical protein [Candidatus Bathyarchaeota archaeon]